MSTTREERASLPTVGDIWKEVDPRTERFVRIESISVSGNTVSIRTVVRTTIGSPENPRTRWADGHRSRLSYVNAGRFNGKRGGYSYHGAAALMPWDLQT